LLDSWITLPAAIINRLMPNVIDLPLIKRLMSKEIGQREPKIFFGKTVRERKWKKN
jgi:hypothetical protein